jgi:uncharacterized protein
MTPEERQLISDLFDRMRSYGAPEKDREAEALIAQSVRANPHATYMLVQSVLVQEQALEVSNNRVQELEDQLRAMQDAQEPRGSRSGGFLGGAWSSGRREEPSRSSVPEVGARATPSAYESRSPWSQGSQGSYQPQPPPAQPAPSGGGFMKSALSTAAGVAGGMVLADSLRNMLGGGGAHASSSTLAGPRETDAKDANEGDNDPGTEDEDNDPGYDDSSGGDEGIET